MDTRTVIKESASIDSAAATSVLEASAAEPARGHLVNPARKLTYRFMSLPYQVRIEIAQKLKLIEDEDSELKDAQRYEAYFRRARERKQLEKLWEEVERAHGARAERSENPFAGY